MGSEHKSDADISVMLKKLDGLYDKEERIKQDINKLQMEYLQLKQDQDLLETMIMHQSNKVDLYNKYRKVLNR